MWFYYKLLGRSLYFSNWICPVLKFLASLSSLSLFVGPVDLFNGDRYGDTTAAAAGEGMEQLFSCSRVLLDLMIPSYILNKFLGIVRVYPLLDL